jgi:putative oxidoreductase
MMADGTNGKKIKMGNRDKKTDMRSILTNKYFLFLSRLCIGLVFIVASIEKIAIPEIFAANIEAYQILPVPIINIVALIIPWLELICGIFLISGVFLRSSSFISSVLLIAFIFLLSSAIMRGLKIDCGCFGASGKSEVSWVRVIEDILLLLLGTNIFIYGTDRNAIVKDA